MTRNRRRPPSAPIYPLVHLAFSLAQSPFVEAARKLHLALHILGLLCLLPFLIAAALISLAYDDLFPRGVDGRTLRQLIDLGRVLVMTPLGWMRQRLLPLCDLIAPAPCLALATVVAADDDDALHLARDLGAFAGLPVWDDDPAVLKDYLPLIAMCAFGAADATGGAGHEDNAARKKDEGIEQDGYPEPGMDGALGIDRFSPDALDVEPLPDACPPLPTPPAHQTGDNKAAKVQRARELIAQGRSKKAAAKEVGVAESTLRTWLKKAAG